MSLLKPSLVLFTAMPLILSACAVGPAYKTPAASVPQSFGEAAHMTDWAPAIPGDGLEKGAWWTVYQDPALDELEQKVVLNNQNVAAAEAAYMQARDVVDEDRATLWPSLSATLGHNRSGGSQTSYTGAVAGSWEIDIWGKTRRLVEQAQDQSQGARATLANALLSAQATLAIDYFSLRATDEQTRLLTRTVANYQHALPLAQNQYAAGTAQRSDVLSADSQLNAARASLADLAIQRGQFQHDIATLIGVPPDGLTLPDGPLASVAPVTPPGVPSSLLQRRPDIAAAERAVASANASIGIADSAYFPSLSLSGTDASSALKLSTLFSAGTMAWSAGAQMSETLLDFGVRKARVREAKAGYDAAVAKYRGTVLTAFQAVEDDLLSLRVLENEQGLRQAAETSAQQAETITLNQYKAGSVAYSSVIIAQNAALSAQTNTLVVRKSRLVASVALIEDLGGGWTVDSLKTK